MFLVDADVPVRKKIVLERTKLDDVLPRDVVDPDRREVGQSGVRTNRRKLVRLDVDDDILSGILVRKGRKDIAVNRVNPEHVVPSIQSNDQRSFLHGMMQRQVIDTTFCSIYMIFDENTNFAGHPASALSHMR